MANLLLLTDMAIHTKYRSDAVEIMDDFAMEGQQLQETLDKIAQINRLLGGNRLTLQGVAELISGLPKGQEIVIVDIGCGNGDMLRALADFAQKSSLRFKLVGIDANAFTIAHAEKLSAEYPNIRYRCENIFEETVMPLDCDIIVCTLTLHHFTDSEILQLVTRFKIQAAVGIVINDLQRSLVAYRLFQLFGFLYRLGPMPKNDGLISILRGFKRKELAQISEKIQLKKYSIRWKWAFRYQWIITNL